MTDQVQPAQESREYRRRWYEANKRWNDEREENARLRADLEQCRREQDRYKTVLGKIAQSGNVHPSWLISDARAALNKIPEPGSARGEQEEEEEN